MGEGDRLTEELRDMLQALEEIYKQTEMSSLFVAITSSRVEQTGETVADKGDSQGDSAAGEMATSTGAEAVLSGSTVSVTHSQDAIDDISNGVALPEALNQFFQKHPEVKSHVRSLNGDRDRDGVFVILRALLLQQSFEPQLEKWLEGDGDRWTKLKSGFKRLFARMRT
ncbi:hypothetical protein POSPLADRAFT_1062720 [Postia placenta MAD-698-R-SB12]|uniref:Uncharacterized protein n=1 Tax=Postia placenta MAD-698-R-SB12 TaxID=670580 RepID=A0A1X6MJL9_9APHY|nr:hypothetical protein POSPLADRAFT_1062720 [Postia placenta MAD-698-R-SB12]OSX56233.1 hypothetical protein POSPLADRAFT_1062720 [Postia placenta MAD-698-R-SB12]